MTNINVICYKVKQPHIYNKGTKYEKTRDEFLACYGLRDKEENIAFCKILNANPDQRRIFCKQHCLNEDNIAYFFHYEQEPFDTRD